MTSKIAGQNSNVIVIGSWLKKTTNKLLRKQLQETITHIQFFVMRITMGSRCEKTIYHLLCVQKILWLVQNTHTAKLVNVENPSGTGHNCPYFRGACILGYKLHFENHTQRPHFTGGLIFQEFEFHKFYWTMLFAWQKIIFFHHLIFSCLLNNFI
jgi:hypothetical protein